MKSNKFVVNFKMRIDEDMFDYIGNMSSKIGCSQSEFVRKLLFNSMITNNFYSRREKDENK